MKRFIWILIVLAIGAYFINSYFDKRAKERAEQEETQRIENAIKASVNDMITKFNAISDWDNILCKGEKVRIEKILTIELEKLWLMDRPILFVGSIEDISTLDDEHYLVRIERSLLNSSKHFISTELGLEVKIKKDIVDVFLDKHPKLFSDYGLSNGVAVTSKIKNIRTEHFTDEEGSKGEIKIGEGNCLSILYTGDVFF